MTKKRILIVSHDKIGLNMAGPGIRYHYMAEILSKYFSVTIGFFSSDFHPEPEFNKSYHTKNLSYENIEDSLKGYDAVIALWLEDVALEYCRNNQIYLVFDVYAPVPVENLSLFMFSGDKVDSSTDYTYRQSYSLYNKFFQYGDLFLFSNRRQLDFWIGYVFGTGIVSVSSYVTRPLFERFIYSPMGIDTSENIQHKKDVIRHVIPGISKTDKVLLWTGGIWNWFDAQTLIKAMKIVSEKDSSIKLVFFGMKHPNPNIPKMKEASNALDLAKQLNLYNKNVFFQEGWVPYGERLNYLLEADIAVNTAKESIESEFSHRTRVLDHILTSLPTVSTEGDYLSDEVLARENMGIAVPPEDAESLAAAIIRSLDPETNQAMRVAISEKRNMYDWNVVLEPLVDTLKSSLEKLPHVEDKPHKEINKSSRLFKLAKKIIPKPIKKIIIKVTRYGQ